MKKNINKKVTIVGSGYVGMSISVMLSQHNQVTVLDIDKIRVDKINQGKSTIQDNEINKFLKEKELNLISTSDYVDAYKEADFIIIATPTNFDSLLNKFDTNSVDLVVEQSLKENPEATIIIKSTIPIGYTEYLNSKFNTNRIIFSPEFLRENSALIDNLYPSRIIAGGDKKLSENFINLIKNSTIKKKAPCLIVGSTEAEAIKLFSNSYLAMRVSFFNELDSFCMFNNLNTKDIIDGVSMDERIGTSYNNPSFGYGGYCLPKDSKQLLSSYKDVPQKIFQAIVDSNETRKILISEFIINLKIKKIGIFKLVMKKNSDNFRSSAIIDIMEILKNEKIEILIYEPQLQDNLFNGINVTKCIDEFKDFSDLIITNRKSKLLNDVEEKVFTRDIFNID